MNLERLILIAFFGESLINVIVVGLVYAIPVGDSDGGYYLQYAFFALVAALVVGYITRWYLRGPIHDPSKFRAALRFGLGGFLISLVWSFVSGFFGLLYGGGTFGDALATIPTFVPYVLSWPTLVLAGYWIIPAMMVGWFLERKPA